MVCPLDIMGSGKGIMGSKSWRGKTGRPTPISHILCLDNEMNASSHDNECMTMKNASSHIRKEVGFVSTSIDTIAGSVGIFRSGAQAKQIRKRLEVNVMQGERGQVHQLQSQARTRIVKVKT